MKEKIKNIKKIHIGEDYTTYSYVNEHGETEEVDIIGIAQDIINVLGEALLVESFLLLKQK